MISLFEHNSGVGDVAAAEMFLLLWEAFEWRHRYREERADGDAWVDLGGEA